MRSLLLGGGLGLLAGVLLLGAFLGDTDGNGLAHIADGEATERGVLGEDFADHGLLGDKLNHTAVSGLDGLGALFHDLTSSSVDLVADLGDLAGNMGGVAIEDG